MPPLFGCSRLLVYLATFPSPHSSVRIVGKPLVGLPRNSVAKKILFLSKISWPAVGPNLPSIQWEQGAVALEVNHQVHAADHTFSFRVVVKNEWSYSSTPPVPQLYAQGKLCCRYRLNLVILSSSPSALRGRLMPWWHVLERGIHLLPYVN